MHIDFDSFFRNRIEGLLIRASWVQALRSMLGLDGVSQIWNGKAAWYFWLQKAPGVYALSFSEAETVDSKGRTFFEGQFALKCYPYVDHPKFSGFSDHERRLIRSKHFDETNTPRFETAETISESLFTVGSFSLLCDTEGEIALLTYQSLDSLRINQGVEIPAALGPEAEGDAGFGRALRDVAGWALGYPLFDCLVGLYANFRRCPPSFIGLTQGPGFEYTVFPDGRSECRTSRRTTQTALTLGFPSSNFDVRLLEALWRSRLDADERIRTAKILPVTPVLRVDEILLPDIIDLNLHWWEIAAADFKSELASACGCREPGCRHGIANGAFEQ